jgi:ArsR family transcriptional regulator, virulence genes transcriptional regulator
MERRRFRKRALTYIYDASNLDFMNIDPLALAPKAAAAESFLKALANRHRLMVLCELHKGEHSVAHLQETVGLSQSSLSQHLARLREDRLVKTRRESQSIYYSLADENVSRFIGLLYDLFCAEQCATTSRSVEKRPARRKLGASP